MKRKKMQSGRWNVRLNAKRCGRALCLTLACLLLVHLGAHAHAQKLIVNGRDLAGLRMDVVSGVAYAPAERFASIIGAIYRFDVQNGLFMGYGGRMLNLPSFLSPAAEAEAAQANPNLLVADGVAAPSRGVIVLNGTPFLPVKAVSSALGARVAYVAGEDAVNVIFPRPELIGLRPPDVALEDERFTLTFNAPVSYEVYYEPSLNVVRFRFARAGLAAFLVAAPRYSGRHFSDAVLVPGAGLLDFNLTLQAGARYSDFAQAAQNGEEVVIDIFRNPPPEALPSAPKVPGTLGLVYDAGTESLAQRLASTLSGRGVPVALRQDVPGESEPRGFGDKAMLWLRSTGEPSRLERGAEPLVRLYYFAGPLPAAPIQSAMVPVALSAEAQARRQRLMPDTAVGKRLAQRLKRGLGEEVAVAEPIGAPLEPLVGAAGRGVVLELTPKARAKEELLAPIAEVLSAVMEARP